MSRTSESAQRPRTEPLAGREPRTRAARGRYCFVRTVPYVLNQPHTHTQSKCEMQWVDLHVDSRSSSYMYGRSRSSSYLDIDLHVKLFVRSNICVTGKIQTKGLCPDARGVVMIHRRLGCCMALRDSRRSDGILLGQKCARCESIKAEKTQD